MNKICKYDNECPNNSYCAFDEKTMKHYWDYFLKIQKRGLKQDLYQQYGKIKTILMH